MNAPWRAMLVIYREVDVQLDLGGGRLQGFRHALSEQEIADAVASFAACPCLLEELSGGYATMTQRVVFAGEPLRTLSPLPKGTFWPSPDDTQAEFPARGDTEHCHSFFVFWPQRDLARDVSIPSGGWGLGMGPQPWSHGMTYATVANAPTWAWSVPRPGEVWLHEWLHGACDIFRTGGCPIPDGDADGGGRHGYVQSPTTGWCDYYRDLMTGRVPEDGTHKGITAKDWCAWKNSRA